MKVKMTQKGLQSLNILSSLVHVIVIAPVYELLFTTIVLQGLIINYFPNY
jgi:hypothetical protein